MLRSLKTIVSPSLFGIPGLAMILLAALLVRIAWSLMVPVIPVSDGVAYATFAQNLLLHGTFGWDPQTPTAFWPPGTTFLHVAALYLFGNDHVAIVILNIAVSMGVLVLGARIALRFFGEKIAVATALILAFWPTLVMYSTVLASELIFLLFTLLALSVWSVKPIRKSLLLALCAGIALGLASLVRPQALLLPFVFMLGVLCLERDFGKTLPQQSAFVGVAFAVMLLVIAPWTLRNHAVFSDVVLVSTNGGVTLWMGNAPGTDGQYLDIPPRYAGLPEVERSRVMGAEAKRIILEDPGAFVKRAAIKAFRLYGNESIGVVWNEKGIQDALGQGWVLPLKYVTRVSWYFLVMLALIGVYEWTRQHGWRSTLGSPVVLMILYFTATHMVVKAQDRYHLAFAAQIAMLSAVGLVSLFERFRARVR